MKLDAIPRLVLAVGAGIGVIGIFVIITLIWGPTGLFAVVAAGLGVLLAAFWFFAVFEHLRIGKD